MTRKQPVCNFAMRLGEHEKRDLVNLAAALNRSLVDTVRVLVREANTILPDLQARAAQYPKPKPAGRPPAR